MEKCRVFIIILNYQQPALTVRLLNSCHELAYPNYEMVVVDNGSADHSIQLITASFPNITLLKNDCNLGYAAGVNVGLRHALAQRADYVLLLNNDTTVAPDMLTHLMRCAEQFQAAAVAPVICHEAQPEIVWSAGANRQSVTDDIRDNKNGERYQGGEAYAVDYATACGILITSDALRKVGLFDERFFMYYEDLDWCWRLNETIMIVPNARMWHRGAATIGGYDSADERYHMALSSVLFFRKHTNGCRWLVVIPFRVFSALRTSWRLLRQQRDKAILSAYWRGLWDGVRS